MDASLYFRLTDRIDLAPTLDDLRRLEMEIELASPHRIERQALTRRLERRATSLQQTERESTSSGLLASA